MENLYRKAVGLSWMPDADATNAPEGAVLLGDNLVDDEAGVLSLRLGSSVLHENLSDDVHSIKTAVLADGNTHQIVGAGDRLYNNGVNFGVIFDGADDIALGDDSYQMFAGRGQTNKKFDGTTLNNWGIPAPEVAPTLEAATAITRNIASFASTGETDIPTTSAANEFVINEGTSSFVANYAGTASAALELVPNSGTGRASASKKFLSDQDYFNVNGATGADTDQFDILTWFEEPRKVDKVTIMFGLGTGTDPFVDDYYYFDFPIRNAQTVNIKDGQSSSISAYKLSATSVTESLTASEVTTIRTPEEATAVLTRLGRYSGSRSRERQDAQEASPAWGHLTVTRGQFNRVGGTAGRDWSTIRGFKVVYTAVPGSTESIYLDSAVFTGGGDLALTGKFTFCYRFVRDTGTYIEMSPVSPVSTAIVLNQQAVEVSIPAASLSAADSQVNQIWVYMNGGFLDTYYRVAITGSTNNSTSMKMDEFAQTADSTIDAADRTRLVNQGLAIPGFTAAGDLTLTLQTNDVQALLDNEILEPGAVGPPDSIKAIAGPWNNRLFTITDEGWLYPSIQTSPSNFSVYHALDLRRYGTPYWMVETNGGIVVGMSKDIIRIAGTGDESADKATIDLYAEPMNVGNPPVDESFFTDGNAVLYRAADGLMSLTGVSLVALSQGQTSLLWRGVQRHGVQPLNITTGRFRIAVDNSILYMLVPEGSSLVDGSGPAVWRYNLKKQTWSRTYYPWNLRSIHREPDGDLVAGTDEGTVVTLETGSDDDGEQIPVTLLLPIADGGQPFNRKDPHDLQAHAETGSRTATVNVFLDGLSAQNSTSSGSFTFSTSSQSVARMNATSLAAFIKAQLKVTGSFSRFVLHGLNLSYRSRPQMAMALDTGYIVAGDRDIAWLQEVELDANSPSDLEMLIYLDDVLYDTLDVPVTANVRTVYRIPVPRGTKSRRPRLVFQTTAADASGHVGFECYSVKVRMRGSGNQTDDGFFPVYPAGQHL